MAFKHPRHQHNNSELWIHPKPVTVDTYVRIDNYHNHKYDIGHWKVTSRKQHTKQQQVEVTAFIDYDIIDCKSL